MVAYCFSAVAGYSAFGSYTGNGSTDGPFVYLGFRPRWVMVKRTDSTIRLVTFGTHPATLTTYETANRLLARYIRRRRLQPTSIDGLSNGFKCRSATVVNVSTGDYIFFGLCRKSSEIRACPLSNTKCHKDAFTQINQETDTGC
jgi:hypothetical protein